jgi:hypothetical protein
MTVTGTLQKVWSLWPSIGEMARDLNESPRVLIEAREADALPDPRHDDALLVRSLWCGTKLDRAMLEHARLRQNSAKARQIIKSERTAEIQAFYDACGGIPCWQSASGSRTTTCTWRSLAGLPAPRCEVRDDERSRAERSRPVREVVRATGLTLVPLVP